MTKSTSGGCDQFETSPEAIDQELRTAFCERRQTDRQTDLSKTNYSVDYYFYLLTSGSSGGASSDGPTLPSLVG